MMSEVRRTVEAGNAAGHTKHVPGVLEALEAYAEVMAAIERSKFIESEKQLQRNAATLARDLKVKDALERAIADETREHDQAIGRLRAEARLQPVSAAESTLTERDITRASARRQQLHEQSITLAALAANAIDADEFESLWSEAIALDHPQAARLVGAAAARRLRELKDAERVPMFRKRIEEAELRFAARFGEWRTAHPSAVQQIADLERRRGQVEALLGTSATFAVELFDAGRAKPVVVNLRAGQRDGAARMQESMPSPSPSGMTVGSNFDRQATNNQ